MEFKRIARVFPSKTRLSPTDPDAYFDIPNFSTPQYDEIHVSITFTWDIERGKELATQWRSRGKVIIGGVAVDGESDKPFVAGRFLMPGVTITSRGCPNHCEFCQVLQGRVVEFDDFPEGNIIQDNNILACSDRHWARVIEMLKNQREIHFSGGLDKFRITPKIAQDLRSLSIRRLYVACDQPSSVEPLRKAVGILRGAGFGREHIHCYVLCGKDIAEEEARMREIWDMGIIPFAQLYKNRENDIQYSQEWKWFQRAWSRPPVIRHRAKHGWPEVRKQ